VIGPDRDIPAPDVGTNAQVMAWIMDTLSMHAGFSVPGVVTGKPLSIGGSIGRSDATGQGIVYTIEATAERLGFKLDGATAAVQGFGNVGEASARLLYEAGARVVAITDIGGGVFDPAGLDVPFLGRYFKEYGTLVGAPNTQSIDNERLFGLELDCWSSPPWRARSPSRTPTPPGADPRRGRERPHQPRGRSDPRRQRRGRDPRHPVQRRRRHRQLLRMGAEPGRSRVDARRGQRPAPPPDPVGRGCCVAPRRGRQDHSSARRAVIAVERVAEATHLRGLYP